MKNNIVVILIFLLSFISIFILKFWHFSTSAYYTDQNDTYSYYYKNSNKHFDKNKKIAFEKHLFKLEKKTKYIFNSYIISSITTIILGIFLIIKILLKKWIN